MGKVLGQGLGRDGRTERHCAGRQPGNEDKREWEMMLTLQAGDTLGAQGGMSGWLGMPTTLDYLPLLAVTRQSSQQLLFTEHQACSRHCAKDGTHMICFKTSSRGCRSILSTPRKWIQKYDEDHSGQQVSEEFWDGN